MLSKKLIEQCQNIKLIFFDIDGTLLDEHGQWSRGLPQQLARLSGQGVKLAIASGRPSFAAQFIFDALPIIDTGLFCTGAELYNPRDKKFLVTHSLSNRDVSAIVKQAKAQNIYTELYTEGAFFVPELTEVTRVHAEHLRVSPEVLPIDTLMQTEPHLTKLLLGNDERKAPGRLDALAQTFPEFEFAFAHFLACPGWRFANVISHKASKITAFNQLLEHHGVKAAEVAAFGDSHSDEVFIEQAGVGVAMGNSTSAQLRLVADYITDNVEDGGVEKVLQFMGSSSSV